MPQISVDQLFSDNQAKLGFEWAAGKAGGNRIITGDAALKPTVGLVGHMNEAARRSETAMPSVDVSATASGSRPSVSTAR